MSASEWRCSRHSRPRRWRGPRSPARRSFWEERAASCFHQRRRAQPGSASRQAGRERRTRSTRTSSSRGKARIKVNTSGVAYAGGIDGTTFIYQHVGFGQSNIALYDFVTPAHSTPSGVNTKAWEWSPSISGDWILFGRQNLTVTPVSDHVILHSELGGVTHVLDTQVGAPDRTLTPGQVNGDYATWDRYTPSTHTGTVRRYQISTLHTFTVPLPAGKIQYASSVDPAGDIFYVRSGIGCGKQVVVRQNVPGGSDVALAALPAGYDVFKTFAVDEGGGVTTVYFDRFNCATGKGADIFKLTLS
jgi:hypothetical protein